MRSNNNKPRDSFKNLDYPIPTKNFATSNYNSVQNFNLFLFPIIL